MNGLEESLLKQLVRSRITGQASEIDRSLRHIAAGNPLGSESSLECLVARMGARSERSQLRCAQDRADRLGVRSDARLSLAS